MNFKKKHISLAASILLVGTFSLTACSSSKSKSTSEVIIPEVKTIRFTGTMIDGYVAGASVYYEGEVVATTDANGNFTVGDIPEGAALSYKGGVDILTGEKFDGELKAPAGSNGDDILVTSLSTIVNSLMESGSTLEEAETKVATSLGITKETLNSDPIKLLKTGTPAQKADAARVYKKILVIQKTAETFSASVGGKNDSFGAVMGAIADSIENGDSIDFIMSDTVKIAEKTAEKLIKTSTDVNVAAKLTAAADSAKVVADTVESINENDFVEAGTDLNIVLETKSKGIEIATSAIEKNMKILAEATDSSSIESAQTDAKETAKAIIMLGGAEGISVKVKEKITIAGEGNTIDASDFGDKFLDQEAIGTQAATFDALVKSGLNEDMVASVGSKVNEGTETSIENIVNEVIEEAKTNGDISDDVEVNVDEIVENVEIGQDSAENSSNAAADAAKVAYEDTVTPITIFNGIDEPTQAPEPEPTQAPTDAPTQAPTDAPTDAPTQAPTDAPTQAPTDAPTQAPTDAPTQAPTDAPTQAPVTNTVTSIGVSGTITETSTVGTNGIFTTTTTDVLSGSNYGDIETELGKVYNFEITVTNPQNSVTTQTANLGVLVKDSSTSNGSGRFLLVSIPVNFSKTNDVITVKVDAGKHMTMIGRDSDINGGSAFKATAENDTANIAVITSSNSTKWSINTANTFNNFTADTTQIGDYIRDLIYKTATTHNDYEISVFYQSGKGIDFSNDKSINLDTITGLSGDLNNELDTLFGNSSSVQGFSGTLKLVAP